ncbi:hypothetical protein [Bacillus infantis]|uniref:hypothetical protein n=1 Tax=Bacillus infantis TaxID=324767 RepID=UPI003CEAD6A4
MENKIWNISLGVTEYKIIKKDNNYTFSVWNGAEWNGVTDKLKQDEIELLREVFDKVINEYNHKLQVSTKEKYILKRIQNSLDYYITKEQTIEPDEMKKLIDQWAFDYEMEKEYRPEMLEE